jgi:hypothetical protein
MHRDCLACRQLWERYYSAVLDEFSWRERLATDSSLRDPGASDPRRAAAELAFSTAAAVRAELAAHQLWHKSGESSETAAKGTSPGL